MGGGVQRKRNRFQSTLPTRGSDVKYVSGRTKKELVSIHAPHEGERRISPCGQSPCRAFQSTLPTRGSDNTIAKGMAPSVEFQSTLPTRGSDKIKPLAQGAGRVSIHAPHEGERHWQRFSAYICRASFNPRSPRGGATWFSHKCCLVMKVSIHAPHEGERPRDALSSRRR